MTPERIFHYFPGFSALQQEQIRALGPLYREWNGKINLIARTDIEHLLERHVLHSLAIARFIRFLPGTEVMDLGTGGGFPGIPLAICFPEVRFTLVDSIAKKIKAVDAIAGQLNLSNVVPVCSRAEQLTGSFDFVVSRATAPLGDLYRWCRKSILKHQRNALPNGLICLKGGDLTDELRPYAGRIETVELKEYFGESFFETKKLIFLPM